MLELRIWQFGIDDVYIDSFLDGMAVAHKERRRSLDWFHWKFEQNPYGQAVLACAFDGKRVAGCVAYGMGIMKFQGVEFKCALSYETFVHPDYQGRGLFKKLILLAENESINKGVVFLYNFPNSNSLTGFKHMGWIECNNLQVFWMNINKPFFAVFHLNDIKKSFLPNKPNLDLIKSISLDDVIPNESSDDVIFPIWTSKYLKWRFLSFPNREYHIANTSDYFAISMVGHRGKLLNVHILYAVSKSKNINVSVYSKDIIRKIRHDLNPTIISYSSTVTDDFLRNRLFFFKVPSRSNFCYKIINPSFAIGTFKTIMPSINAHTY